MRKIGTSEILYSCAGFQIGVHDFAKDYRSFRFIEIAVSNTELKRANILIPTDTLDISKIYNVLDFFSTDYYISAWFRFTNDGKIAFVEANCRAWEVESVYIIGIN